MDKKDLAQDKKMIAGAVHKHEKAKHKGQPLTKLAKGGKTNANMLRWGATLPRLLTKRTLYGGDNETS